MRFSIVRLMCIMLLALVLFVPAAGAIYVPGQTIPDDGQPHILLAGADTPTSDVLLPGDEPDMMYALDSAVPVGAIASPYDGDLSLVSDMYPAMIATSAVSARDYNPSGIPVAMPTMPAELKAYDPKLATRVCDGISRAILAFPEVCVPNRQSPAMPDMIIGNSIWHFAAPSMPGYWDKIDPRSLHTNMPVL